MPARPPKSNTDDPGSLVSILHAALLLFSVYMILARLSALLPSSSSSPLSASSPLASSLPVALLASVLPAVMLGRLFRPVRYYLRLTTFLLGLASNSVWGVVVSLVMAAAGRAGDVNWVVARSFWRSTAPLVGITFRVEGEEYLTDKEGPAVIVGNHQTMLDILYLGRIFPKATSIMAKRELKFMPLLGQFMTFSNAIFVNRTKRDDAIKMFAKVAEEMKRKSLSLFIFPEGTRSASPVPSMLPFKKGAFHLAVQAQVPIIPIVCENYAGVYSSKAKRFAGGEVVIRVLPPIQTTGITSTSEDINALVDRTRDAMLAAIEDLGRLRAEANRLESGRSAGGVQASEETDAEGENERTRLLPSGEGVVGERE
ncbi:hypothetical protein JCM6882_005472 [Rhodosporidiobolus microsporus]